MRVLVISPGGRASRADVDLARTTADLLAALRAEGQVVVIHEPVTDLDEVSRAVAAWRPDVVFNVCETLGGGAEEEPTVPRLLEEMGVPFTGNTAACLSRCLDKRCAAEALRAGGVAGPAVYAPADVPDDAYPVIVKPALEDGSVGVHARSVARDAAELAAALDTLDAEGYEPVVQRYVEGREISVALLGWPALRPLSPGEILYDARAFQDRPRILTYASKWEPDSPDYGGTRSVGADVDRTLLQVLEEAAREAARAVGMRDYGRVDFRVDEEGTPFVIDVNPNCDLSTDGGFMLAARRSGLTYPKAVQAVLAGAIARARC